MAAIVGLHATASAVLGSSGNSQQPIKIFVGGFRIDTQESDLYKHFSAYGEICDVMIIRNRSTSISKGYGFISTCNHQTYDKIMAVRHELNGRILDCFPGFKKNGNPELFEKICGLKIFVGGVSVETTDKDLWDYFANYGAVRKAYVIRDPHTNRSRKFGFVIMEKEEDVVRVLSSNQHRVKNNIVTIKRFAKEEDFIKEKVDRKKAKSTQEKKHATDSHGKSKVQKSKISASNAVPVQTEWVPSSKASSRASKKQKSAEAETKLASDGDSLEAVTGKKTLDHCDANLRFNISSFRPPYMIRGISFAAPFTSGWQ